MAFVREPAGGRPFAALEITEAILRLLVLHALNQVKRADSALNILPLSHEGSMTACVRLPQACRVSSAVEQRFCNALRVIPACVPPYLTAWKALHFRAATYLFVPQF
ncbi:MAG: hypothetical protein ABSC26_12950, partial [Stellaceae bacterium]